jgi:hypothetical protein
MPDRKALIRDLNEIVNKLDEEALGRLVAVAERFGKNVSYEEFSQAMLRTFTEQQVSRFWAVLVVNFDKRNSDFRTISLPYEWLFSVEKTPRTVSAPIWNYFRTWLKNL